MKTYPVHN